MSDQPNQPQQWSNAPIFALLIAIIVGGSYLYINGENRTAVRTGDYERCWSEACKIEVARAASARLMRGL